MPDGKEVFSYLLDNKNGIKMEVIPFGAIIRSLYVLNKNGEFVDIVLGRKTLQDYIDTTDYFGATVGRCANRITKGKFELNGKKYQLTINNGENSLHGGIIGFHKYLWDVEKEIDSDEPTLIMSMTSPDGDQGYPANLKIRLTYKLTKDNVLYIHYDAESDGDTIVNLTNHSFFNLNGEGSGQILDHKLLINGNYFTPCNLDSSLTGEIWGTKDTPFDFSSLKRVGKDIDKDYSQLKISGGYDHNYIIDGSGFRHFATLIGDKTGIRMDTYSDKPAMQFYSGNFLDEQFPCKNEHIYKIYSAICLETQHFPNAINFSHFPSPILRKGEKYDYTTEYRFSIQKD